jgi:hypothetical protein
MTARDHPWPARLPPEVPPQGPVDTPEGRVLYGFIEANERRIDKIDMDLPGLLKNAVEDAISGRIPTEEEQRWVRLAIKREAQSIALRQAIIEKTLTGLIWSAVAGLGALVWTLVSEYAKSHGWRP